MGTQIVEKRVYSVEEIMQLLGISRNNAIALIQSGAFHYVKVGRLYKISKKSFDKWLSQEVKV